MMRRVIARRRNLRRNPFEPCLTGHASKDLEAESKHKRGLRNALAATAKRVRNGVRNRLAVRGKRGRIRGCNDGRLALQAHRKPHRNRPSPRMRGYRLPM